VDVDALTKATLLSTEAPFARGFLTSDAIAEPSSSASGRVATLEGMRAATAVILLVAGVLLLAEAIVTLTWQEPFSAWSAARQQDELNAELRYAESAALAAPAGFASQRSPVTTAPAEFAERHRRATDNGDPLGRLRIPRIGVKFVFVEGANPGQLEKGPGHYAGTALPGERGTVGVAGHRTTYLAPFRNIDALRKGDSILMQMPYGRFRYEVEGSIVVSPGNTRSLRPVKHDRLVLTTCTPLFSAAQRLVVTARLESSKLRPGLSGVRRDSRRPRLR
jgi:sortase A